MRSLFHLAYHVTDLDEARRFYGDVLGCEEGRSTETWVDFDFFGHQISLHLGKPFETTNTGKVGDHMVPMPHLGVILPLADWLTLSERLEAAAIAFEIPPVIRFAGEPGEQRTMFFRDPSGNRSRSRASRTSRACSRANDAVSMLAQYGIMPYISRRE